MDMLPENQTVEANFSFWVTVAFTLNYILGSGFLTLPWGFAKSGVLLGLVVLLVFAFYSTLSVFFILEALDRGQRLVQRSQTGELEMSTYSRKRGYVAISDNSSIHGSNGGILTNNSLHSRSDKILRNNKLPDVENDGKQDQIIVLESLTANSTSLTQEDATLPMKLVRKIEITELCTIFLGPVGQRLYTCTISMYMYGTLWAYTTVFANAFAAHLSLTHIHDTDYMIYTLIFALVVVPVSLMEFSEQVSVQVALAVFLSHNKRT